MPATDPAAETSTLRVAATTTTMNPSRHPSATATMRVGTTTTMNRTSVALTLLALGLLAVLAMLQ